VYFLYSVYASASAFFNASSVAAFTLRTCTFPLTRFVISISICLPLVSWIRILRVPSLTSIVRWPLITRTDILLALCSPTIRNPCSVLGRAVGFGSALGNAASARRATVAFLLAASFFKAAPAAALVAASSDDSSFFSTYRQRVVRSRSVLSAASVNGPITAPPAATSRFDAARRV